jgi:hypothetical protein
MKKLLSYGFAAALVLLTALPALAKSYDVCLDAGDDAVSGFNFVAVANVYPGGTISSAAAVTCSTLDASPIGTFFAQGVAVSELPKASSTDSLYVVWHFRINGQGAFDTSGPVETTATYPQTIIGSTNIFLAPITGTATVTNLAANAFRVTVPLL